MNPQKVTLFKALLHVGYSRVAPRTLSRGNNLVQFKFSDGMGKWYINTPFGGGIYSGSKDALHALVLRFAIDVEDLKKMVEIGFTYAQEELDSYERTMKKIEQNSTKAFMGFMKEEQKSSNESVDRSTLSDILREFKKQVVFSRLEKELERNNNSCPVCGKEFFDSASLYNHASRTSNMKEAHRNFLMVIMNEVTGLTP